MNKRTKTNRFKVTAGISFPQGDEGSNVRRWFNLENMGMELIPFNVKIPQKVKDRAWLLNACRRVELEIEVSKTGSWKLINAKLL